MPTLMIESQRVFNILREIGQNNLIGYQISGAASSFANLAGLCIQLQIVIKNQHTLIDYRGVGCLSSIGKVQHDKFRKWATEYSLATEGKGISISELMQGDTITPEFFKLPLVSDTLTRFLSEKIEELDDDDSSDELKRFFGGGGSNDDDDDKGHPPPRYTPKRKDREGDELFPDIPPPKNPKLTSIPGPSAPSIYPGGVLREMAAEAPEAMDEDDSSIVFPPLEPKEASIDISQASRDQSSGRDSGTSPSAKIGTLIKMPLTQAIPSFIMESYSNVIPQAQIKSVKSSKQILSCQLKFDNAWCLFPYAIGDLINPSTVLVVTSWSPTERQLEIFAKSNSCHIS
jgi:hypothetical protein